MAVIPALHIHECLTGSQMSGQLPNGTLSTEINGRLVRYTGCTESGRIDAPSPSGLRVAAVSVNMPGTGGVQLRLYEPDGFWYLLYAAAERETVLPNDDMFLIPPGWSFRVVANGPVAGPSNGRVMVSMNKGLPEYGLAQLFT